MDNDLQMLRHNNCFQLKMKKRIHIDITKCNDFSKFRALRKITQNTVNFYISKVNYITTVHNFYKEHTDTEETQIFELYVNRETNPKLIKPLVDDVFKEIWECIILVVKHLYEGYFSDTLNDKDKNMYALFHIPQDFESVMDFNNVPTQLRTELETYLNNESNIYIKEKVNQISTYIHTIYYHIIIDFCKKLVGDGDLLPAAQKNRDNLLKYIDNQTIDYDITMSAKYIADMVSKLIYMNETKITYTGEKDTTYSLVLYPFLASNTLTRIKRDCMYYVNEFYATLESFVKSRGSLPRETVEVLEVIMNAYIT